MTGQYDHNNGMRHQQDIAHLDLNTTVQHVLHQNGYQTAVVGKYLHAWGRPRRRRLRPLGDVASRRSTTTRQ